MDSYLSERYSQQRGRNLAMVFFMILVSLGAHICILYFFGDVALNITSSVTHQVKKAFKLEDIPPPMHVEMSAEDPLRVAHRIAGERDTPSHGPVDLSRRVEELRRDPPPALTAPSPIPSEALTPNMPALKEAIVDKVDTTPWLPRQEIKQIYDRVVQDEEAALPRHEIPVIERIADAPDIVPSIDLSGRQFGKDPPPPKPFESAEIFDTKIIQGTFKVPVPQDIPRAIDHTTASLTSDKFAIKPNEKSGKVRERVQEAEKEGTSPKEGKGGKGSDTPEGTSQSGKERVRTPQEKPFVPANPAEQQAKKTQDKIAQIHEDIGYIPIDNLLAVGLETYQDKEEPDRTYFRIAIQPRVDIPVPVVPKDIVFVQDVSGSVTKDRIIFCQRALKAALNTLNTTDRFNIVAFRDTFEYCFTGWVPSTPENIRKADEFIQGMRAYGRTDVFGSLRTLVQLPRDPRRPMIAYVITDGIPTKGTLESAKIIGEFSTLNSGMIAVYMYGLFSSSNTYLLDMLTYCNRGNANILKGNRWEIPASMAQSYESIRNPVMSDISVMFDTSSKSEIYPRKPENLYKDRPLEICGVCPRTTESVVFQIRGLAADKGYDSVFRLNLKREAQSGRAVVKRRWALQKMYHLVGEYSRRPNPAVMEEMVNLHKKYDIEIPYKKNLW